MTEAELYDHLQRTFGIGDWDEATATMPWWRFRANEIAKLKAMLKRRGATVEQVYAAAEYAQEEGRAVRATYQLFALIPEAMTARRNKARAADAARAAAEIEEAMAEAMDEGNHEWVDRFLRVSPSEAAAVITEWRNR